jgi:DNA-binding NarL/FixJ family response regulator
METKSDERYCAVNKHISILVGERDDLLREKISGILSREKNVKMVTQMADCSDISGVVDRAKPDIVLLGAACINGGKDQVAKIALMSPQTKIVIYADECDEASLKTVKRLGAHFLIQRDKMIAELHRVLEG